MQQQLSPEERDEHVRLYNAWREVEEEYANLLPKWEHLVEGREPPSFLPTEQLNQAGERRQQTREALNRFCTGHGLPRW